MPIKTVLVVDDDRDIVRLLSDALKYEQFAVIPAYSGEEALHQINENKIDFIILDIMMPGLDGLEVCRTVRQQYNIPILILSARDRDVDKVIGLEIGADDYMTKPFSIQELTSRVKAHFRKLERLQKEWSTMQDESQPQAQCIVDGPLVLNEATFETFLHGKKIELSTKEFQILLYLSLHPNQVLSREQIYENVWGDEYGEINTVTVHIKNIRKKLDKELDCIKTVWGIGYKFVMAGN
ncbi:response regulator transcription factor [Paenibacillus sp. 7124]|uniref:Response regulator transcription factor n=1 Tax=Paenibacillus apii TaxID=1850370 RepID=A0A6M1PU83_9BACL|nr:response regulator transcription factor [Paenibacillus apii]NGM85273.1 response regulator transcription factor [Paenibacillus apii]NJJ41854.1 response regulator transcription factor [Paenibacillus apii]